MRQAVLKTHDIHMGDPFIYVHQGAYYLIGTTDASEGFRAYQSDDLELWREAGWILRKKDARFGLDCFWAPEMFIHNGLFFLTYSALTESGKLQMALSVSASPIGPFQSLHAPWFACDTGSIDGHIFRDEDGSLYLYFSKNWRDDRGVSHGENYAARLKDDLSGPDGRIHFISRAEMDWETPLPLNRCNEGPTVIRHEDEYYMTYSANDTVSDVYGIGYLKSKNPLTGWEKISKTPWLTTGDAIFSPGHNSIFRDLNGNLKIVFHSLQTRGVFDRIVNIRDLAIENGRLRLL